MKTWFILAGIFLHTVFLADGYKLFLGTFDASHPEQAQKRADEIARKRRKQVYKRLSKKYAIKKELSGLLNQYAFRIKQLLSEQKILQSVQDWTFFPKDIPLQRMRIREKYRKSGRKSLSTEERNREGKVL